MCICASIYMFTRVHVNTKLYWNQLCKDLLVYMDVDAYVEWYKSDRYAVPYQ